MAVEVRISGAVGAKDRRGQPAPNKPEDVKRIQALLNGAAGRQRVPPTGKADPATLAAIGEFQKLWQLAPDNRVDPGGKTITRLNWTVTPLVVTNADVVKISKGGYWIKYSGHVPPRGYTVHLGFDYPGNCMDVSARPSGDLLSDKNLPEFLALIDKKRAWGTVAKLRVFLARDGKLVTRSNEKTFKAPVEPYAGKLGKDMLSETAMKGMIYSGNKTGRFFHIPDIDGKYYFAYGGSFETSNQLRGLNCITYVGAVFNVPATTGAMSSYGTQLADHLGATKVDMEGKKEEDIKTFFEEHPSGTYFMWSSTHMVIVNDATVHEFSLSKNGYVETPVEDWNYHGKTYWIRKAPRDL